MRPWKLLEANYAYVKDHPYEVAVLPMGATEPHNLHLPYGTDVFEADTVGEKMCEAAHNAGAKVVLLPTVPYGTETNQRHFPLAMNVNPSTLDAVITDLVESLAQHGIRKVVLLNSHGGNDFKALLRELYGRTLNGGSSHVFLCNWYQVINDFYETVFERHDDHAGEMETSFALAYFGHLVAKHPDGTLAADDGTMQSTRFEAINRGWVGMTRPWHLLTTNSGAGNPHAATAEKGGKMIELLVPRLSQFLVELSEAKIDEKFPY